jgi:N-acetylmuramoyl-L-alanine amidase
MALQLPSLVWVPSPNISERNPDHVDLIVVHDCEGSYDGSVSWFADKRSNVSAHIVLNDDGTRATYMVDVAKKAWHACLYNSRSVGIEMAGWAKQGFTGGELQADATIVAYLLKKFDIPFRWAQRGVGAGVCRHYDLGEAGGGHNDPTTDITIWNAMLARIEAAYKAMPPEIPNWLEDAKHVLGMVPKMPDGFNPTMTVRSDEAPNWPEEPDLSRFLRYMAVAFNQWRKLGWSFQSVCGLLAAAEIYSDGDTLYGWNPARLRIIFDGCGIKADQADIDQQVIAANWELHNTERVALVKIDNAETAQSAGGMVDVYYIRAGTMVGATRTQKAAQRWAAYLSTDAGKALLAANPV